MAESLAESWLNRLSDQERTRFCLDLCDTFDVTHPGVIGWAHSVTSIKKLEEALVSDCHMIEADVGIGYVVESAELAALQAEAEKRGSKTRVDKLKGS